MLQDCNDTLAYSSGRLLACVGVQSLVVVETPDAVLVVDQRHTQDVKKIVDRLKREGCRGHAAPQGVPPLGLVRRCGRGRALPGQAHHGQAWRQALADAPPSCRALGRGARHGARDQGRRGFLLTENQSTYIPLGVTHRLENPGHVDLEMIEVQSGSYLGRTTSCVWGMCMGADPVQTPPGCMAGTAGGLVSLNQSIYVLRSSTVCCSGI
jgi:mannose-1-phosphate guanylyltransferase/mannose-6-phosphate isomerase